MEDKFKGFVSIIVIKEGNLSFFADLSKWAIEWFQQNGYEEGIMRNTPEGYYEILAKPKPDNDES